MVMNEQDEWKKTRASVTPTKIIVRLRRIEIVECSWRTHTQTPESHTKWLLVKLIKTAPVIFSGVVSQIGPFSFIKKDKFFFRKKFEVKLGNFWMNINFCEHF